MYLNYGDENFFEYGILVDSEHSDDAYDMLICRPYCDEEDAYQFCHIYVDITDSWIDKKKVMDYIGMSEQDFDPILFAIGAVDYYGPENFGADSYGVTYDWRHVDRQTIENELKHYLICYNEDGSLERPSDVR